MNKMLCILLAALFLLSSCGSPASAPESADKAGGQAAVPEVTAGPAPADDPAPAAVLYPGDAGFRYEGDGFDTPEDAVLYYLAGLKNLNYEQMLRAFAWETLAAHYDFRAYLSYRRAYDPNSTVPIIPFGEEPMLSANVEMLRGTEAACIYLSLAEFGNPAPFEDRRTRVAIADEAEYDAYVNGFDPDRIAKLTEMGDVRFYTPDDITGGYFSKKAGEYYQPYNAAFGADEVRDLAAVADIRDETIGIAPVAARYGDRWYLVSMRSMTYSYLPADQIYSSGFFAVTGKIVERLQSCSSVRTAPLPEAEYGGFRYEGDGFDTPEEAVACYLEGLKNRNVQQMMKAFAWETQSSRYSLRDYIPGMSSQVNLEYGVGLPSLNDLTQAANLVQLRNQQCRYINMAIRLYALDGEELPVNMAMGRVPLMTDEDTDAFLNLFRNERMLKLGEISNIRTAAPEMLIPSYIQAKYIPEYLEKYRVVYGADEIRDIAGIADMGDETLFCNPLAARYGDRWYLVSLGGGSSLLYDGKWQQGFFTRKGTLEDALAEIWQNGK